MKRPPYHPGFTLIETMAVLLIIAVLAAAVMINPSRWFQSSRLQDAANRVVFMDRLARQYAQRVGRAVDLVFDLEDGLIHRRQAQDDEDSPQDDGRRVGLPGGFEVQRVIVSHRETDWEQEQITVPFSTQGHTPSYAVLITGPDEQTMWVVFAGLSGQALTAKNEEEVKDVFEQLSS